jgi:hypothetical protein
VKKPIFFLPLLALILGASACTDGPAYFSVEPGLTSPDSVVMGVWENGKLICSTELTIHAPVPITIPSGKVILHYTFPVSYSDLPGHAWWSHEYTLEEISEMWGTQELKGRNTGTFDPEPPFLRNSEYDVTVKLNYDGSPKLPQLTGILSHTWKCVPPS